MRTLSMMRGAAVVLALVLPVLAQADPSGLQLQAVAGEPFGVCVVRTGPREAAEGLGALAAFEQAMQAGPRELGGRLLYPAHEARGGTHYFLFKGDQPLEVTLGNLTRRVAVSREVADLKPLLAAWWQAYTHQAQWAAEHDVYEPAAETYLTAMLARRLALGGEGLRPGRLRWSAGADDVAGLLLGTESIRLAMQREVLLDDRSRLEKADQPLPTAAAPPTVPLPGFNAGAVKVEPLALRVPKACFYLRSPNLVEFRWLRGMLDLWGGEFRNLLATRGADYRIRARLERQLALRDTELSRTFGGLAVEDVALIGTDTFFREGSALGVLFHAKHNRLLATHLADLRARIQKEDPAVLASCVKVGDRTCSLLSRPDNAVRSFYVSDVDFHLVTNSRWIAEAFLRTVEDPAQSLGSLQEFRYARSRMPAARDGAAFLYLSDPFFRNLVGPAYRVEMTRRARSQAELAVVPMARLAARAEGSSAATVPQLIQEGFLPVGFGERSDGSRIEERDGVVLDSLRGGRGSFLPVPDMPVTALTPAEAEAYAHFARAYAGLWTYMDPVFAAITHAPAGKGGEKVALAFHISPYAKSRYGLLEGVLGQPGSQRLGEIRGNLLSAEAVLKAEPRFSARQAPSAGSPQASQHVFGGLRDFAVPFRLQAGEVAPDDSWTGVLGTSVLGYVGQTEAKRGGLMELLFRDGDVRPDARVYLPLPAPWLDEEAEGTRGLWARFFGRFIVTGIDKRTLEQVTPQLKLQKAERPAQVRLKLGNLGASRLGPFLTAYLYARDRRVSAANALLLEYLGQQFHLAPEETLAAAEAWLGQKLVDPLGGTYQRLSDGPGRWRSTAWREESLGLVAQVPKEYRPAALAWIQALALEFCIDPQALQTRLELWVNPTAAPVQK